MNQTSHDSKNTSPLKLWQGEFGKRYHAENVDDARKSADRTALWQRVLAQTEVMRDGIKPPTSFIEFGAGMGNNIRALQRIYPSGDFMAVEPNIIACDELANYRVEVDNSDAARTIFEDKCADVAITCGLLIHVHPESLLRTMARIYRCSRTWIASVEYWSKESEVKQYRGHEALFKRDWGRYWLENFALECVSYGFNWKQMDGVDDCTFFLFRKR